MARNYKVQVEIHAKDNASGVLKGVGSSLSGLGDIAKTALGFVGGELLLGGIRKLGSELMTLAQAGPAIDGISNAFAGLTGNADEALAKLREGALGMVSDRELMMSYNQAAQLVGQTFADQLPEAMGYLSKVAAATGQDMGFMMDSLVKGVGRLSPMILDNLGIQVNLTEASEAYAAQIGKSVDELTKQEQQTAMMNMVMQKLAENTAKMPEVAGSAAQGMASFGVILQNFKDKAAVTLLPVLGDVMGILGKAADVILPKVSKGLEILAFTLDAFLSGAPGDAPWEDVFPPWLADIMYTLAHGVEAAVQAVRQGATPLEAFRAILATFVPPEVMARLDEITAAIGAFIGQAVSFVREHADAFKAALVAIGAVLAAAAIGSAIAGIAAAIAGLANPITLVIAAVGLLAAAWSENWGGIQEKTAAVWEFLRPILEAIAAFFVEQFGKVKAWVDENMPLIQQTIQTVLNAIQVAWEWLWPHLLTLLQGTWESIKIAIEGAITAIQHILKAVMLAINGDWKGAWNEIKSYFADMWDTIKRLLENALSTILALFGMTIPEFLEAGRNIIQGIINGIGEKAGAIKDKLLDVVRNAWNSVLNFLGIRSPSMLFAEIGVNMMLGLAEGLTEGQREVLKTMAELVQAIAGSVNAALEALAALAAFEGVGDVRGKLENLVANLSHIVGAIGTISAIHRLEYVKPAAEWARQVKDMVAIIKPAIDALAELAEYTPGQSIAAQMGDLAAQLGEIVTTLVDLSAGYEVAGVQAAAAFGQAAGQIVGVVGPAIDAIGALAEYEAMGSVLESIQNVADRLSEIVPVLSSLAARYELEGMQAASAFYQAASGILNIIRPGIEAIVSLGEFDGSKSVLFQVQDLARRLSEIAVILAKMANQYNVEAYQSASVFFQAAKGIVDIVKPGIDAIVALTTFDGSHSVLFQVQEFARRLSEVVVILGTMGQRYQVEGYQAASTFYQAASGIIGIVKPGIDAITTLATYEPVQMLETTLDWFVSQLLTVVDWLYAAALDFSTEGMEHAVTFYDAVSGIVKAVKPGVDTLTALLEYEPVKQLETALDWFVSQLLSVVDWLQAAAVDFEAEGYEAAAAFYQAVAKIVGVVKPGVEALAALAAYQAVENLPAQMAAFRKQLIQVVNEMVAIASGYDAEGLEATAAFATAVKTIADGMKAALDLLGKLLKYEGGPLMDALSLFRKDIYTLLDGLAEFARIMGGDGLAYAHDFRDSAEELRDIVAEGVGLIAYLGEDVAAPSVLSALKTFGTATHSAMQAAVQAVRNGLNSIIGLLRDTSSSLYAAAFNAGLAIGQGVIYGMQTKIGGGGVSPYPTSASTTNNYNLTVNQSGKLDSAADLNDQVTLMRMATA